MNNRVLRKLIALLVLVSLGGVHNEPGKFF